MIPAAFPPILPRPSRRDLDSLEIRDVQPLFGHPQVLEVVAQHGLDQDNLDLAQIMNHPDTLLGRERLIGFSLSKQHVPGREFRVERKNDFLRGKPVG